MKHEQSTDIVVIGSGVAGSLAAYRLAQKGYKVIILEAGPRIDRAAALTASNLATGTVAYARLPVGTAANTIAAGDDARLTNARTPTGDAGGDLSGTYPNPTLKTSASVDADRPVGTNSIKDGAITDAKIAGITTAGKVSGAAITTGTIGGNAAINTTGTISSGAITSSGAMSATGLTTSGAAGHVFGPAGTTAGSTGEMRMLELAATGTEYVGFKAPDNIATSLIWTLPSADGSNGQLLQTVAKWNGSTWTGLGASTGVGGSVTALAYDPSSSSLYVGGGFSSAGGVANIQGIAKWNASGWSALGTGLSLLMSGVLALATDSTAALYVGGDFLSAGGITNTRNIAKWDGGAWASIATTAPNGAIYAFATDPATNDVYAGGTFTTINGVSANYIAKWNGSVWTALGSGMNAQVKALAWDSSTATLSAGGNFSTAGGTSAPYIAKWNGSNWSRVGATGADYSVNALALDGSRKVLATGGAFNAVDNVIRPILALYYALMGVWM